MSKMKTVKDILKVTGGMVLGSAGTIVYIAYKEYKDGRVLGEIACKIDVIKELVDDLKLFVDMRKDAIWYAENEAKYKNRRRASLDDDEEYDDSVDEEVEEEV